MHLLSHHRSFSVNARRLPNRLTSSPENVPRYTVSKVVPSAAKRWGAQGISIDARWGSAVEYLTEVYGEGFSNREDICPYAFRKHLETLQSNGYELCRETLDFCAIVFTQSRQPRSLLDTLSFVILKDGGFCLDGISEFVWRRLLLSLSTANPALYLEVFSFVREYTNISIDRLLRSVLLYAGTRPAPRLHAALQTLDEISRYSTEKEIDTSLGARCCDSVADFYVIQHRYERLRGDVVWSTLLLFSLEYLRGCKRRGDGMDRAFALMRERRVVELAKQPHAQKVLEEVLLVVFATTTVGSNAKEMMARRKGEFEVRHLRQLVSGSAKRVVDSGDVHYEMCLQLLHRLASLREVSGITLANVVAMLRRIGETEKIAQMRIIARDNRIRLARD